MRAYLVVAIAACGSPAPSPDPAPRSVVATPATTGVASGTVAIGGDRAAWDYAFDRNQLAQVRATAHGVIAVTASGHLLRFDPDSLALVAEAVASPPVRCLSQGEPLYAGADGTIEAIDPTTLAATTIAAVDGTPMWIGTYAGGTKLAVAVMRDRDVRVHRFELRDRTAIGAITVPQRDLPARPAAWFLDRQDRLWYGIDAGEWGGMVGRIDLATARTTKIEGLSDPVMGFTSVDNAVWAYGGLVHMGMTEGFVVEIVADTAKVVWKKDNFAKVAADPPGHPVVALWQSGTKIRAVLWRDLFEASRDLRSWTKVATIRAQARGGRPDSVGSYPAIRDIATMRGDVVVATGYDGLFRIHGDNVEHHAIADQLATKVGAIRLSGPGPFLRERYTGLPPWRPDRDRWYAVDLAALGDDLYSYELVARPGRAPWILAERTDGAGIVSRWRGSGFAAIWRGKEPSRGALAIGDDLWALTGGKIWRFDREWLEIGSYTGEYSGDDMTVVDDTGLVVIHRDAHALARLVADGPTRAHLAPIAARDVRDAVVDGNRIIVATTAGLFRLDGDHLAPLAVPALPGVAHLARDDRGRVWEAADDRLGFVGADMKLVLVALPMLHGRPIEALVHDPTTGDLLVALGASGVVRIHLR